MLEKYLALTALVLIVFASGCLNQLTPQKEEVVCNPPYIRFGAECCLDENANQVCDRDEQVKALAAETSSTVPASTMPVTSTVAKTASLTQTTVPATTSVLATTSISIACYNFSQCPADQQGKLRCDGNAVKRDDTTFYCAYPGTEKAECKGKVKAKTISTCGAGERCVGGQCLGEDGQPVATTLGCAWNKGECDAYCLDKCTDQAMTVKDCVLDLTSCTCSVICQGASATTVPSTTQPATTTTPGTTTVTATTVPSTTITVTSSCEGDLHDDNTCDGACNTDCETCELYPNTPCYWCKKDCGILGSGWTNSLTCDLNHNVLERNDACGCYKCTEVCPKDDGYYLRPGCDGDCASILCRNVSESQPQSQYKDCLMCYPPVCGNGLIEPGEDCEVDADCLGYAYCDADCECQPDCIDFCDDQGVNGYQWINDGVGGSPNIASSAACSNWAQAKLTAISAQCKTSCVASASYSYDGSYACCCVDWNSLACADCPGQNPVCPPTQDCKDTL